MLRFETESDGNVTTIRVIGRLQASDIEDLRLALKDVESRAVLDLSELLLVDLPARATSENGYPESAQHAELAKPTSSAGK
jgi:hypothetical protein